MKNILVFITFLFVIHSFSQTTNKSVFVNFIENPIVLDANLNENEWKDSKEVQAGTECLLDLWQTSKERHPYMFYMGTDFRKIKAPLIWYDILHVLNVVSPFEWLRKDPRLREMIEIVKSKANNEGKFVPESIWMAWKGWDFGQKKQPSRWLTFLILKMLKRTGY